jgi:hypothetical protein
MPCSERCESSWTRDRPPSTKRRWRARLRRGPATLRQLGGDVTATHNHALMDTPRLFYMHFWANDDPIELAQTLKASLDVTNSKKP